MSTPEPPRKQTVYRGKEQTEVVIPMSAMLKNGRLDIFEEVRGKNYFRVYSKGADLVFQCGAFVGLIPINEDVAIDVAPRVKISNLDRILQKSGAAHTLFTLLSRDYAASEETSYLTDLLADALIGAVEGISEWGKYKEYARTVHHGHPRSGRILVKETFRLRAKNSGSVSASTARFERGTDNAFNVCIKFALEQLMRRLSQDRSNRHRLRISRLNVAWQSFSEVDVRGEALQVAAEVERRLVVERLAAPYLRALPLATAVLRGLGPSQRNLPPSFSLGSLIFNVADAFEIYLRLCLAENCAAMVLDGNAFPPTGAKQLLFPGSKHSLTRNVHTTPDILINDDHGKPLCVLDVKYKPYENMPDRDDVNQVLTYALAYGSTTCALAYPSSTEVGRVEDFGTAGGVRFFGFAIGLNAPDLIAEERRFASDVCTALGISLHPH